MRLLHHLLFLRRHLRLLTLLFISALSWPSASATKQQTEIKGKLGSKGTKRVVLPLSFSPCLPIRPIVLIEGNSSPLLRERQRKREKVLSEEGGHA